MRGDEEYKARWTDGEAIQLNDLQIASRTPSALLRRVTRRGLLKARLGILEAEQRLRRRMRLPERLTEAVRAAARLAPPDSGPSADSFGGGLG
jgi:hypothetical protein